MARPIWDGEITFGLINIPVHLYSAEKRNELSFHLLDAEDESRIRNERVNESTGAPVPWERIVKGYEVDDGRHIILTREDFEAADLHGTHTIDLIGFVSQEAVAPIYYKKPYYLAPTKHGEKGYHLLLQTLQRSGKGGLAKFVLRTREYLGLVMPWHGVLALMVLRFAEDIAQEPQEVVDKAKARQKKSIANEREVAMAESLVKAMSIDWDPAAYHDEYKEKLLAWIDKKARARKPLKMPKYKPSSEKSNVVNMFDLLKRSVNRTSGGGERRQTASARKKTASKASGKSQRPLRRASSASSHRTARKRA